MMKKNEHEKAIAILERLEHMYHMIKRDAIKQRGKQTDMTYADSGNEFWKAYYKEEAIQQAISILKGESL